MTSSACSNTIQQDETENSPNNTCNNYKLSCENDQEKSTLGK